jgi:hypothetical protein
MTGRKVSAVRNEGDRERGGIGGGCGCGCVCGCGGVRREFAYARSDVGRYVARCARGRGESERERVGGGGRGPTVAGR